MNLKKTLLVLSLTLASASSFAGPYTDKFSACLADNTTGKERKELARWIFVAMAAHPDMRDLSRITPATREGSNKAMGVLVTKLIAETCAKEAQMASKIEGGESFRSAFELLGKLAMQELMSNPEVSSTVQGFQSYVDRKKVEAALTSK